VSMVLAVRGATTVEIDEEDQVIDRVCELVNKIFLDNKLENDSVISLLFSVTSDVISINPAAALRRGNGNNTVPLFCTQEPKSIGSLSKAIRVLITWNNDKKVDVFPSYLHGAKILRPDLIQ